MTPKPCRAGFQNAMKSGGVARSPWLMWPEPLESRDLAGVGVALRGRAHTLRWLKVKVPKYHEEGRGFYKP
jgi:hypothetical protein